MKISSQDLFELVLAIAQTEEITTLEGLLDFIEKKNSVYEIVED